MKIVFANLEKLDFRNTIENVSLIESVEQLKNATNEDTTYVLAVSEEYFKNCGRKQKCSIYSIH